MLSNAAIVGFIASTDLDASTAFYGGVLGLEQIDRIGDSACTFKVPGGSLRVIHVGEVVLAPYTVLGWEVDDVTTTAKALAGHGVAAEIYDGFGQDDDGVWTAPSGARIIWFKDPEGHVLSLSQNPV